MLQVAGPCHWQKWSDRPLVQRQSAVRPAELPVSGQLEVVFRLD